MSAKPFKFRRILLFVYLGVAVYYYCTLDREKALAWLEKVAVKAATVYAQKKVDSILQQQQQLNRLPASPQSGLVPAPPPPTENRPEILAAAPALKVGQIFKFHYRLEDPNLQKPLKELNLEWELVSSANKQLTWEDGDGTSETFSSVPFLPPVSASGNSIRPKEKNLISGDIDSFFPLTKGKLKTFAIRENDSVSYEVACSVGQPAPVTTAVGAFKTIPVSCSSVAPRFFNDVFYYAPQLNHWVVRDREFTHNGIVHHLRVELTGFSFAEPSLRKPAAR